ncbi:hypothetical protein EYF80_057213 [Liparis tanakae]|uniref:Uncharacterized protein n=1 Tax=Liparis tanakae TaxID=230148 RepID=A0A4Z2EWJ8_9TELE|nr:hypothetical protein EYF80_057213 [Liparis tanakae]
MQHRAGTNQLAVISHVTSGWGRSHNTLHFCRCGVAGFGKAARGGRGEEQVLLQEQDLLEEPGHRATTSSRCEEPAGAERRETRGREEEEEGP